MKLPSDRKALIMYLCVGDPDENESVDLALACLEAGADVLELGCPFSDPTADGAAIARASQRALRVGGGVEMTLRVSRAIRAHSSAPLVLFGYYNPLFVRGEARAVTEAKDAGIDAMLVVDLPFDTAAPLRDFASDAGLPLIPLVAPTTSNTRLQTLGAKRPLPFIYYVSSLGVTGGTRGVKLLEGASDRAAEVRQITHVPVIVGFGIDGPDAARAAAAKADGIAVGTALVRRIEDGPSASARREAIVTLVRQLRESLDHTK